MRAKITIAFFSISLLVSFGLDSNQAFAGNGCESDCQASADQAEEECNTEGILTPTQCAAFALIVLNDCIIFECRAVGGEMIAVETTPLLVAGAQANAAWMIPVIVSAIGIGIVIARKF